MYIIWTTGRVLKKDGIFDLTFDVGEIRSINSRGEVSTYQGTLTIPFLKEETAKTILADIKTKQADLNNERKPASIDDYSL